MAPPDAGRPAKDAGDGKADGGNDAGVIAVSIEGVTTPMTVDDKRTFAAKVTGTSSPAVTWSVVEPGGGTISAAGEYTASATPGAYTIVAKSQVDATKRAEVSIKVVAAPSATMAAPLIATAGASGLSASVSAQEGVSYAWTITNGTITSGDGTNAVTFTVGADGETTLSCVVTNEAGSPATGSAVVAISATPVGSITAPASVKGNSTENTANVPAQSGATYAWTITNGTITAGADTPSITFSVGSEGPVTIGCTVTNAAGTSVDGSAVVTVDSGEIDLTVTGAPTNAVVGVSGPNGFSESFASSATLTGLAAGEYAVSSTMTVEDGYSYTPAIIGSPATVTNGAASAVSVVFTKSNGAPTISRIANQSTTVSTAIADIPFTISDVEDSATDLTITAVVVDAPPSFGTALTVGGSGAARTLTIAPDANAGVRQIAVTVTDSHGLTATTSFYVTVDVATGVSPIVTSELESSTTVGTLKYVVANVASGAVITFAPSVYGKTITFTSAGGGTLGFTKNVTVWGPGASLVSVSGNDAVRVFANATSTVSASLHGLTIEHGNATGGNGGGLNNNGIATITNCVFSANQAPNVGGAINSSRSLTIDGCSFIGNTTGNLGTIYQNSFSSATIRNSVFSGNVGSINGVAVAGATEANIVNCTVAASPTAASKAVFAAAGAVLRISQSTLVGTGGSTIGVYGQNSGTSIVLKGNVISNFGSMVTLLSSATVSSLGGNVLDAADSDFVAQTSDAVGVSLGLDALGDYGGSTESVRLQSSSTAVDHVAGACTDAQDNAITTDQRGYARPAGAGCDSGAFERQPTD
jgi:hypothetical protein